MLVTVSGRMIDVNPRQPQKAYGEMVFTPSGTVTEVNSEQ